MPGVEFLAAHPDYSVAHGCGVVVILDEAGAYGRLVGAGRYPMFSVEQATGRERLSAFLRRYYVTFGIHRTAQMRDAHARLPDLPDKPFREILPLCISAVQGKVKQLPGLFVVRQSHNRRYLLPDVYDWVVGSSWGEAYRIFQDQLIKALIEQDRLSADQACQVVKRAFWWYLRQVLSSDWQERMAGLQPGLVARVRAAVRGVPGARRAWSRIRPWLPGESRQWTVDGLTHPGRPFADAFGPVYQVLSGEPSTVAAAGDGHG